MDQLKEILAHQQEMTTSLVEIRLSLKHIKERLDSINGRVVGSEERIRLMEVESVRRGAQGCDPLRQISEGISEKIEENYRCIQGLEDQLTKLNTSIKTSAVWAEEMKPVIKALVVVVILMALSHSREILSILR